MRRRRKRRLGEALAVASDARLPPFSPGDPPSKGAGSLYSSVPVPMRDPAPLPFLQASVGSKVSPCHLNGRAEGQNNRLGGGGRSTTDHSEALT